MNVVIKTRGRTVRFHFNLESDDKPRVNERVSMAARSATIKLPKGCNAKRVHPDHLAVAAILMARPFVGRRLVIPGPVSTEFLEAIGKFGFELVVDSRDTLPPYRPPPLSRPGLSFSGGVDSVAALAVMPANTVSVFLERPRRRRAPRYNKTAALRAVKGIRHAGFVAYAVPCDLEFLRDPVGFPLDVAVAVPTILVASQLGLDSIAFGTIAEAAYRIGHREYRHYPSTTHYRGLGGLFSAVGLPFNLVVGGISEVGTTKICHQASFGHLAQSCTRTASGEPCDACPKCFRKSLLGSLLSGQQPTESRLDRLLAARESQRYLAALPIRHENVLAYSLQRYDGPHPVLRLLRKRVRGDQLDLRWLERWFPPSAELVPERHRDSVVQAINRFLTPMTEDEQRTFSSWNMTPFIESKQASSLHRQFLELAGIEPR